MPISCSKRGLRDIIIMQSQLMITRSKVYLREVARSLKLVKQIVNPREWIMILDGQLVQFTIVYAHEKRSILLLDKQTKLSHPAKAESQGMINRHHHNTRRQNREN
ncbi:hypothetical protein Tco_0741508 [Tanacetum coccineum]